MPKHNPFCCSVPSPASGVEIDAEGLAIHLAQLVANLASEIAQDNLTEAAKVNGIELAEDGAFTVDLENGQRFQVRVTEVS